MSTYKVQVQLYNYGALQRTEIIKVDADNETQARSQADNHYKQWGHKMIYCTAYVIGKATKMEAQND